MGSQQRRVSYVMCSLQGQRSSWEMRVMHKAQIQWFASLSSIVGCLAEGSSAIWQEAEAGRLFGARDPLLLMTLPVRDPTSVTYRGDKSLG